MGKRTGKSKILRAHIRYLENALSVSQKITADLLKKINEVHVDRNEDK